jgi:hypothetical protein
MRGWTPKTATSAQMRPSTLLQWVETNDSACKTLYSVTARSDGPGKIPDGSQAPAVTRQQQVPHERG